MDPRTGIWTAVTFRGKGLSFLSNYFPNIRGKIRLLMLYSKYILSNRLLLENCNNLRITVNPTDYIGGALLRDKTFEIASIQLCGKLLSGGGVFYDIGANFGLYSMSLASIPNVRCIAVEALPDIAASFLDNLALNPPLPITFYLGAASRNYGYLSFDCPCEGNHGTGKVSKDHTHLKVASIQLKDILTPYSDVNRIVMKVDIEGHELEALNGIDFSRPEAPSHIITEYEPGLTREAAFIEMQILLKNAGYTPCSVFGVPILEFKKELMPENNIWWTRAPFALAREKLVD